MLHVVISRHLIWRVRVSSWKNLMLAALHVLSSQWLIDPYIINCGVRVYMIYWYVLSTGPQNLGCCRGMQPHMPPLYNVQYLGTLGPHMFDTGL